MNLFKTSKINLAKCLYFPNQTRQCNIKRLLANLVAILTVVSHLLFLFFGAEGVTDYMIAGFWTTTILGVFGSYIHTTIETETIFTLIDCDINDIVEMS